MGDMGLYSGRLCNNNLPELEEEENWMSLYQKKVLRISKIEGSDEENKDTFE
jgi:hypothetical protein